MPATNARPVRIWSQDESRWDVMTVRRRRITVCGVKPVGNIQHHYANCWCFGCVAPATGEADFQRLPKRDAANMQIVLDGCAERQQDTFTIIGLGRSGAHTAKALRMPENIALSFLPARSPELNPIERVWEDVRGQMAWKWFPQLAWLQDALDAVLANYTHERLPSLSGYAYLVAAELAMVS